MTATKVKIGERWVGDGEPCFIIAEPGSNHDGKFEQALQLIDVAAEAGADAVKFQTFRAEEHFSKKTPQFSYLQEQYASKSTFDLIKENEMPREWQPELAAYAKKKDILFMSTPSDREAIRQLMDLGMPVIKTASFEATDLEFIAHLAQQGVPLLVSTGMCSLADIEDILEAVYSTGNRDVILLHAVSLYPTRNDLMNLRAMDTLRQAFQVPVGLSDHTTRVAVPIGAVARGACVVEKHYTLSRKLKGPDHPFALEPDEFKVMVNGIRDVEAALGSPIKGMIPEEEEMARLGRRGIIARIHIAKGAVITGDMLIMKRPGYGIRPKDKGLIVGRRAVRDIEADDIIIWDMIGEPAG